MATDSKGCVASFKSRQVCWRERIAKIPPDGTKDDAGFGLPPFEDRRSGSHFAILSRHQPATLKLQHIRLPYIR
jgi:hypothetical protein